MGATALLAGASYAQAPVAWWENPVAAGLTLSDAQRDQINGIARDYRDRLVQKREEANRAEQELEGIFNADVVDTQRGRIAIDRLARARADLTKDVSRMTLQMRTVLTTEQWRTLQNRREDRKSGDRQGQRAAGRKGFQPPPAGAGSGLVPSNR
jgi:Spy/CpxP family protein refolding chaperone